MTGCNLSLKPGSPPWLIGSDIPWVVGGGSIDAPDETPIEDTPDWSPGDGVPGDVVVRGGAIAVARLLENGVTYKNPQAGPGNKKVKATLVETAEPQGVIAPLVVDGDNYAGVAFDPSEGKLKASKTVAGVDTALGEATVSPLSGTTVIGAVTSADQMWMTVDGQIVGGPYNVSEIADATQSGIVAKGAASATAWIADYESRALTKGYGRGHGISYGGA